MQPSERQRRIHELLQDAFDPIELLVKDQSHLHAGHAGASDGRGHFDVRIVAEAFTGQKAMQRHRMVYAALGDMMQTEIHALSIRASSPED